MLLERFLHLGLLAFHPGKPHPALAAHHPSASHHHRAWRPNQQQQHHGDILSGPGAGALATTAAAGATTYPGDEAGRFRAAAAAVGMDEAGQFGLAPLVAVRAGVVAALHASLTPGPATLEAARGAHLTAVNRVGGLVGSGGLGMVLGVEGWVQVAHTCALVVVTRSEGR